MTPLAHRIVKETTLPLKQRTFVDQCRLLERMDDIHCFEVSEVFEAAGEITTTEASRGRALDVLAFLPAPKTWIEWRRTTPAGDRFREGVLLEETLDGLASAAFWACNTTSCFASAKEFGVLKLRGDGLLSSSHYAVRIIPGETDAERKGWTLIIYALLAMINTPRIIGRTTRMPNAGLQREIAKSRGMVGKFPLHAYTEIKLKVGAPKVEARDDEIWLSGQRALHFVRSHLRIRLGQLELVSAHWRGDPALGIKRSKYKLVGAPARRREQGRGHV